MLRLLQPLTRKALATAPRVGTVERVEYWPWTPGRAMKLAGNTIGLILVSLVLYTWFFDTGSNAASTSGPQPPAAPERVE